MNAKKKRKIISFGLVLSLFFLVLSAAIPWKGTFIFTTLIPVLQTLFNPETLEWKPTQSPEGDLAFESPLAIHWNKKDNLKEGIGYHSQFGTCRANPAGFSISGSSIHFVIMDPPRDSKKIQEDILQSYHGEQGFHFESKAITCSGMPATLLTGAYQYGLQSQYFSYLLVTTKNWNWTIHILYDNAEKFSAMAQRAVESVRIKPKDP